MVSGSQLRGIGSQTLGFIPMKHNPCILIVEDDYLVADALTIVVEDLGFGTCEIARTVQEAVDAANAHHPILVLMDLELEGNGDGVDAATQIHATHDCPIIFLTANINPSAKRRILEDKPAAVLTKPFSAQELKRVMRNTLRRHLATREDGARDKRRPVT
jgi:two-component system, response regulator PdtaR